MCNTLGNIFRLCIMGGVALGLTMQFLATFACDFLLTEGGSLGIWYIEDESGECVDWVDQDGAVSGAQSALTIATCAGFITGVLVAFEWLLCEICCAGCIEGLGFACAWLVGGATFSMYAIPECGDSASGNQFEDGTCEWGPAATYMIIANIAYLACGILLCCTPQPEPICKQGS